MITAKRYNHCWTVVSDTPRYKQLLLNNWMLYHTWSCPSRQQAIPAAAPYCAIAESIEGGYYTDRLGELNVPMLRKDLEFVTASAEAQDGRWDQDVWAAPRLLRPDGGLYPETDQGYLTEVLLANANTCGTAYCVAGFTCAQLPGYQVKVGLADDGEPFIVETIDGRCFTHSEVAARELGLTQHEADVLFGSGNSASFIRSVMEAIVGEVTGERL